MAPLLRPQCKLCFAYVHCGFQGSAFSVLQTEHQQHHDASHAHAMLLTVHAAPCMLRMLTILVRSRIQDGGVRGADACHT